MLDLLTAMPWFVLTASLHCRKVHPGWSNIMKRFEIYLDTKFVLIKAVYRLYKNCLQNYRQKVWLEIEQKTWKKHQQTKHQPMNVNETLADKTLVEKKYR